MNFRGQQCGGWGQGGRDGAKEGGIKGLNSNGKIAIKKIFLS